MIMIDLRQLNHSNPNFLCNPLTLSSFSFLAFIFFSNMKAIITGASGLLGRATTKQFQNAGWEGNEIQPHQCHY